ncbi:MAG: MFS transporter [Mycobacterium leprae]
MAVRFPEGLRAFNHRDFRIFWLGQLISLIGTWMQTVGQSWLILELTNSPFKLGLISTLQFLPMLALALVAGAVIDRLPKRKVVIGTQSIFMLLAFVLAALVWTGRVQYWHVAVLALLLGLVNTLDMPARQAFIVEMVGKEDLLNAIALNSAVFNGARILGPAAAGILIGKYGVALGFFLNGLSFIAVIAALFLIRAEGLPRPRLQGANILHEIAEGVRFAIHTPLIFFALSLLGSVSLFVINFGVLVPLLARNMLNQGAQGFGILMAAMGAGALIGAMILAMQGRSSPGIGVFVLLGSVLCVSAFATGFVHSFTLALVLMALTGGSQILFTSLGNTMLQVNSPDELRGRVMSFYALVFAGTTPIGSFFLGLITERWGAAAGWWSGGLFGLLSVGAIVLWFRARQGAGVGPLPTER